MRKKGLSYEQKKERMLAIFHSKVRTLLRKKDVFNYHELEKEGGKVGVHFKIVKEILEALKADNLIEN